MNIFRNLNKMNFLFEKWIKTGKKREPAKKEDEIIFTVNNARVI